MYEIGVFLINIICTVLIIIMINNINDKIVQLRLSNEQY